MLCDVNQSNVFISVWFYFISFVKYHVHVFSFRFNWIYFVWIQYPLAFISVHSISMKMNNNKNTHTTRQIVPLIYRWLWNENYILYEWIELNSAHLCNNHRKKRSISWQKFVFYLCDRSVFRSLLYDHVPSPFFNVLIHFCTDWFRNRWMNFLNSVHSIFQTTNTQFQWTYWLSMVISMGYFSSKTWNSLHQ